MATRPFRDRREAAFHLGNALVRFRHRHPLVLAIPRGAAPIGRIVADMLAGEFDVVLVRKLCAPFNPELAIGAVDENGTVRLNRFAGALGADAAYVERAAQRERDVMRERRRRYLGGGPSIPVEGRIVIVIDDGMATGTTMFAALDAVRAGHPAQLVCAVPVASRESVSEARRHADEVVSLVTPGAFGAVGSWYEDFAPVSDEEVAALLNAPQTQTSPCRPDRMRPRAEPIGSERPA